MFIQSLFRVYLGLFMVGLVFIQGLFRVYLGFIWVGSGSIFEFA